MTTPAKTTIPAKPAASAPSLWAEPGKFLSFDNLRKQIDQLFADFGTGPAFPALSGADFDFSPTAELHETDKDVTIRVELAGVDQKDIDIEVIDDVIAISGEKKAESEKKDGDRVRTERRYGSFYRSFTLPFVIDDKAVDARFENGVLTVRLAKPAAAAAAPARRVAIKG